MVTFGKHKPAYMGEYHTSSARLITIERSAIVEQLRAEKLYGLSVKNKDKKAKFGWEAGVWANGQRDCAWTEPDFDSDASYMVGGSVSMATGDAGRLYRGYMHSFSKSSGVKRTLTTNSV